MAKLSQYSRGQPGAGKFQKNETGEARLSTQIYNLRQRQKRAQWVAAWVAEDWNNWYQLSHADQTLWAEHNDGTIQRQIADLQARQQPRFPGVAECLAAEAVLNGLLNRPALSDVKP